jgi:hypothetical protein
MMQSANQVDFKCIWNLIKVPLMAFLVSRAVCFLAGSIFAAYGSIVHPFWRMAPRQPWIDWTARFDTGWYHGIVMEGYSFAPGIQSNVAFFPLFPSIISIMNRCGIPPLYGALVINHIAFFSALIILHRIALKHSSNPVCADNACWILALFPTSFFFSCYYTESLFLVLVLGCIHSVDNKRWATAVLLAALASATRIPGAFLYPVILLEWMRAGGWTISGLWQFSAWMNLVNYSRANWRTLLLIQLSFSGLVAFMVFLTIQFGDPLVFYKSQQTWGRPWQGVLRVIWDGVCHSPFKPVQFVNLTSLLVGLGLTVVVYRRMGEGYAVFCLLGLLLPGSTSLLSMSRFVLVIPPLFLCMGVLMGNSVWRFPFMVATTVLLVWFTGRHAVWSFVA